MLFWIIIKVALKSLRANKMRSMLATLGIIIGVAAVISMLALGAGAQQDVTQRLSAMGTNLLVVRPAQRGMMGVMAGTQQNLTLEDAEAIVGLLRVSVVAPVVMGNAQVKFLNKNTRTSVTGTAITYLPMRDFQVERGEMFSEMDVDRNGRVAVLGPKTVENLFGAQEPLGQTIKLNGINFRVVGVLKSKGDQGFFNPDDQVFIPYTTAMKQVFGLTYVREIDVQAKQIDDLKPLQSDISELMRRRHRVVGGMPDDVEVQNRNDMIEAFSASSKTFTVLLGGIASISLLVGGIGIMNIMLVTVTERTREIGVRKAIGAKSRDIRLQFLIEAILMSGLGGLVGVLAGVGAAKAFGPLAPFPMIIQPFSIVMSLGFSGMVGVFFGFYPAQRAAKLDPIEALRYE